MMMDAFLFWHLRGIEIPIRQLSGAVLSSVCTIKLTSNILFNVFLFQTYIVHNRVVQLLPGCAHDSANSIRVSNSGGMLWS